VQVTALKAALRDMQASVDGLQRNLILSYAQMAQIEKKHIEDLAAIKAENKTQFDKVAALLLQLVSRERKEAPPTVKHSMFPDARKSDDFCQQQVDVIDQELAMTNSFAEVDPDTGLKWDNFSLAGNDAPLCKQKTRLPAPYCSILKKTPPLHIVTVKEKSFPMDRGRPPSEMTPNPAKAA
jgi:hypothetical protein